MGLFPNSWGRVAKAASVILVVARLPTLFSEPATAAEVTGTIFGILLGAYIFVAIPRWFYVSAKRVWRNHVIKDGETG